MQVTSVILIISEVSYVNWSLWKFSHYLLISMPMETLSGASQKNSVAAFSSTTEADGDFFKNMKWLHSPRSVLISRINWLIILPINCQKERAHHNFSEPKSEVFRKLLLSSQQSLHLYESDKEKQHIFTFQKMETAYFWHFGLKNDWNNECLAFFCSSTNWLNDSLL